MAGFDPEVDFGSCSCSSWFPAPAQLGQEALALRTAKPDDAVVVVTVAGGHDFHVEPFLADRTELPGLHRGSPDMRIGQGSILQQLSASSLVM